MHHLLKSAVRTTALGLFLPLLLFVVVFAAESQVAAFYQPKPAAVADVKDQTEQPLETCAGCRGEAESSQAE